jgi:hypothetical protein
LLHYLALADLKDIDFLGMGEEKDRPALDAKSPGARVGLEFFYRLKYIEKAGDFMLGKKSPLCATGERRPELGGTYSHPDFGSLNKLLTAMITDPELASRYPMSETETRMILHPDLLKTMLGSATGSKEFGECLANMCRDDAKLSRKVAKVFLRAIDAHATVESAKGYLKALKPFLRMDDSLKAQKLEWVFGIPEPASRKLYMAGAERSKWGVELVDRLQEDAVKYVSPILRGAAGDEALSTQLVKCKGRFDVQCLGGLKEVLSVMRKDRTIAHFIYNLPGPSYQYARFTDWFRPFLEEQLADTSRASSQHYAATSGFMKSKYDLLAKACTHLDALEPTFAEFEAEQLA